MILIKTNIIDNKIENMLHVVYKTILIYDTIRKKLHAPLRRIISPITYSNSIFNNLASPGNDGRSITRLR